MIDDHALPSGCLLEPRAYIGSKVDRCSSRGKSRHRGISNNQGERGGGKGGQNILEPAFIKSMRHEGVYMQNIALKGVCRYWM